MAATNKEKKQKTRRKQKKSKRHQNRRKSIRKMRGGAFSMPIAYVIPYNNYIEGDVQREIVSTRILP